MNLTSPAFANGQQIPSIYTCQGRNVNPALHWADPPQGTKSFALIIDDPDAPMGTWVHWLVKDIPASTRSISEDSVPGVQVLNSFRKEGYGGPCPPSGTHRYFFKLYALDVETLSAKDSTTFYAAVEQHKLAEAVLMGTYKKT